MNRRCGASITPVAHGDAFVKDETFAIEMASADLLEIVQDAAVELEHPIDTHLGQKDRRLFAADPAGAIADDGLASKNVLARQSPQRADR